MKTQFEIKLAVVSKQLIGCFRSFVRTSTGKMLLYLALATTLSACLEIKQSISLKADGSGNMDVKIVVDKQWAHMIVPELKKALQKDSSSGMEFTEGQDESGNSVLKIVAAFNNVSELNDKDMRYTFVPDGGDLFRSNYRFEMRQLATVRNELGTPIPFEFRVRMPGTINETNGHKVASDEVRWSLTGIKKGTVLIAKSSALAPTAMLVFGVGAILVILAIVFFGSKVRSATSEAPPVPHSSTAVFCTECGQANLSKSAFCTGCGQKILDE